MKLYIANCTKQPHDFHYRVPADDGQGFTRRIQIQRIEPGTQQQIHMETVPVVLEAIVSQHRNYGLVPASEAVKTKLFIGLCYNYDKPVDLDKLAYALDHNQGVLQERGEENRERLAVAIDQGLSDMVDDSRRQGRAIPDLRGVDVETMEDSDSPSFAQAIRVDHGHQRADGRNIPTVNGRARGRKGGRAGATAH